MPIVLIDIPVHAPSLARLKALDNIEVRLVDKPEEAKRPLPADLIRDVDILMCTFPPENFEDMKRLKWLQITSVGYSQLYGLGMMEKGIRAANGRGNTNIAIGEWSVAMMVNLGRNLRKMIQNQDAGIWDRSAEFQKELRGATVGIWGYGGIGRETARLAKAMGMTVHVMSRGGVQPAGDTYYVPGTADPDGTLPDRVFLAGQELEFLSNLDFLVLSMPLTQATQGIIGERELRALPKTAYILNPARGPLIQEQPLLRALSEGWIAGTALDTHYHYPMPSDHPLWRMPNVIMTPHISGSSLSPHYVTRTWDILIINVERDLVGKPLINQLSNAQLQGG